MTDGHAEMLDSLETIEKLCNLMGEREKELNELIEENKRLKEALATAGRQPAAAVQTPSPDTGQADPAKIRILVVDDSKMDRRVTTGLLESVGITNIALAEAGKEAMVLIEAARFHLVLLDYEMSDGNGMWFLHSCQELGIKVPVILISGTLDKQIVRECMKLGAVDFLVKPIQKELLISRIEKALNVKLSR